MMAHVRRNPGPQILTAKSNDQKPQSLEAGHRRHKRSLQGAQESGGHLQQIEGGDVGRAQLQLLLQHGCVGALQQP